MMALLHYSASRCITRTCTNVYTHICIYILLYIRWVSVLMASLLPGASSGIKHAYTNICTHIFTYSFIGAGFCVDGIAAPLGLALYYTRIYKHMHTHIYIFMYRRWVRCWWHCYSIGLRALLCTHMQTYTHIYTYVFTYRRWVQCWWHCYSIGLRAELLCVDWGESFFLFSKCGEGEALRLAAEEAGEWGGQSCGGLCLWLWLFLCVLSLRFKGWWRLVCCLPARQSVLQCVAVWCNALQCLVGRAFFSPSWILAINFHIYEQPMHYSTHCNAIKHTATHCNTLQHIATHCNTLQNTVFQIANTVLVMYLWLYLCIGLLIVLCFSLFLCPFHGLCLCLCQCQCLCLCLFQCLRFCFCHFLCFFHGLCLCLCLCLRLVSESWVCFKVFVYACIYACACHRGRKTICIT